MLLNLPTQKVGQLLGADDEGDEDAEVEAWSKINLGGISEDEARFLLSRRLDSGIGVI